MLGNRPPRGWAASPTAIIASSSDGATVNVGKAYALSLHVEKTAAGSPLPLPAITSLGSGAASRGGGKDSAVHGSDGAVARGPASPFPTSPSVSVGLRTAKAAASGGGFSSSAATSTLPLPRSDEEVTQYVLYDGLPQIGPAARRAQKRQSEAYYQFQHRIHERTESAHALVLSANPLSLSVMASQLRMYRWRVTQAQTLTEATSILQDYVIDTARHGYRVRRRAPPPFGQSRYAHGRGRAALKRRAQAELERLSGVQPAAENSAGVSIDGARVGRGISAAPRHPKDRGASDSRAAEVAEGEEEEELDEAAFEDDAESALPPPPPDTLPRLVLVDTFTHEDLGDIARHVRFVDQEHGLEMLLVLLLPGEAGTMTASMQGAGCVITPTHQMTMEDAYAVGYDLVLAHNMDHLLVDFFTSEFVSSVGRWRNDVRSKAAVGNYMSLRSVLLGGLDTAALQRLIWDDRIDDTGVLELLGAQSLSTQGGTQRYGAATRHLLQQQGTAAEAEAPAKRYGSGASRSSRGDSGESDADLAQSVNESILLTGVPRLRNRPTSVAHFGVRLPAQQCAVHEPLSSFSTKRDVFSSVMAQPAGARQSQRRRHGQASGAKDLECDADNNDDALKHQQRLLQGALETELGRLLAENEGKQASIDAMQEEVERLQRTVTVLRRHQRGAPSASGDGSNANQISEPSESGSMIHLSKQQQIFILKERLEAANDRIAALLRGGRLSGVPPSPRRRGGGRGGSLSRRPRGSSASGGPRTPTKTPSPTAYSAFLTKVTVQEAEQMAALDSDANASLDQLELHRQELIAAANNTAGQTAAGQKQRREREAVNQVIHSLQLELQQLQGRLDDTRPGSSRAEAEGCEGLQARMASRLQSALEVMEAQKVRIRHLEELRQMDQLLHTTFSREGSKGRKKGAGRSTESISGVSGGSDEADHEHGSSSFSADEEGDAFASARGTARGRRVRQARAKGKKAAKSRFGVELVSAGKKGAAGGGGGVAPSRGVTKGGLDAAEDAESDSAQKMDMEEVAARRTEAAVHDAVTSLQRTHRRQLAALVQTCKMQLARVALKLQKPSTSAYTALLREELSRALCEQRAAWMRLRCTLRDLTPDQYDATLAERASSSAAETPLLISLRVTPTPEPEATDSGAALRARDDANMVPLGAVTDPHVQSTAANIAREYAAYGLRIAYVSSELQRVEQHMMDSSRHLPEFAPAAMPAVADTPPEQQLLSVYQAAKARVQETVDTCGPIQEYLEAVQAELAIEQQFRPWCDVNSEQLFSAASTALVPSTLSIGASMSGSAAAYDHTLHNTHSSTVSTTADQLVLLADVDASMRDVADVYATMLRALTPKGSEAAMSISTTSSGSISRHHASPPARVSKKRDSKKRRQSAVSPTQPKPAALQRRFVAKAADKRSSFSPDESDSLLPLRGPAGFTVEEALDALPIQPDDVACYQGQLGAIDISEGVHSAAQQRLYKFILRAYQQHCIHPVHMAAVESALSLPLLGDRGSGISNDVSRESSASASEALVDLMSAQATAVHAQHREIMALLELIAPTMTQAVRTLTKGLQRVQHLLDHEDDSAAFAEAFNGTGPPCTSPVFLTAVDAAVLGCVVDELRWREWRYSLLQSKKDGTDSSDPAPFPTAGATPSELLRALILARRGRSGGGRRATPTADGGADLEDARTIGHYAAFCAARERAACNAYSNQGSSVPGPSESLSSEAEDLFHLTDAPPMLVVPSKSRGIISALAATGGDNADVGLTVAHELAALFSTRRQQDAHGDDDKAAALLEEIYLGDGEYGGAGVLGGDSNTEAMHSIRRELEYLQAAKQQRMWELMMRFELQKERCAGKTDGSGRLVSKFGTASARGAEDRASLPSIDPDRLDFEVKSGSAAWYGMEAAKRVHNILRRRARPDQIIVGGGPHGGSVGIELSRRTAQPGSSTAGSSKTGNFGGAGAAPGCGVLGQEDEGYVDSSADEAALFTLGPYASHQRSGCSTGRATPSTVRLPPLRQHLLSRAQQGRDGLAGHGGNTTLMAGVGYLSPRDVISLNAYGSMTPGGAYDYAGATEPLHAAGSLTEQVLAYREALMRSAGRVVPMPFTAYANGDPYCLPLSTWPASSGKVGAAGSGRYDPLDRQLPSPVPLPDLTAWVYGVPEGYASSLLQQQHTGSHQRQNMALFMPRYGCSPLAEVEGRQRACMASAVPPSLSRGRSFPAGAPTYSTPAALAAQRLQAMLSVSMRDPSVAAVPAATEAATTGSRGALPTTRGRAYPVHSRRSDGAATAQPRSPAPPLTKRALASASAGVDGAAPSSETDGRTAGEGEVSEPNYESFVFDEKDLNPLAETLGPAKGSSS
ncbi:conserved hypothetical protein [Leishmania major strain Friedlin]|uniref:Uncharacterized protein n=1 Tax=Leishmania major TaxID=5664 RepID=Q4QHI8_LEIMA|nr:conserved hypothetical protein [Leishmania major strain Friedlin]CAG9570004.1 hypothetical_protein_-_conserved [Leishmania major strain Friedlin]CAJ02462.1 conserved hypothetical protein [Leishmania major strain Friedlin]|eukprot:XP_001681360.1 conserved hypothetical protein [Leishmania major strain Friedlin]